MIDVNKPVTNPELVEIMNKYLSDNSPENEFVLIDRITRAQFISPIILDGEI